MGFFGFLLATTSAALHVLFFYLESIAFPTSRKVQVIFLGSSPTQDKIDATRTFLQNQGFYNLFLALGTLYGLVSNTASIVRFTLFVYVGAGAVLLATSPRSYRGALMQIIPAFLALCLY